MMRKVNFNPALRFMAIGLFLVYATTLPAQAGQVVGQVTAVDASRNTIDINGIKLQLSASAVKKANARDAASLLRDFKPGQAVLFEADKNELKRIEAAVGGVDFPAHLKPGTRVPGGGLPKP